MRQYKFPTLCAALCCISATLWSCKDEITYADQKERERKTINAFLNRDLTLLSQYGDTLVHTDKKIEVISEQQFLLQDSTTDLERNQFVLFNNSGVYMQIVRKGPGKPIANGETKRIICRYFEYNILGDSLQSTNMAYELATMPDIIDASNNSGTISATFNTSYIGGGAMYLYYNSTAVPKGWIVPLSYINLGRQTTPNEGIAKVRLIVPHSEGHTQASQGVYPCFYEISFQEMRE